MILEFTARIVAERRDGHWSAWFADDPTYGCGGLSALQAIERLLDAHPERAVIRDQIVLVDETQQDDRLEFLIPVTPSRTCPDCGGSGKYIGLHEVEPCRACDGHGYLA